MIAVLTIGYEGATTDAFDAALLSAGVRLVVDVRAIAGSRRRGFSKTALADRLSGAGIDYVHMKALGDPKTGRLAARAGRWQEFNAIYSAQLATPQARDDITRLGQLIRQRRVALLCFEAEAALCHRSLIARELASSENVEVTHLKVGGAPSQGNERQGTGDHPGEGGSAREPTISGDGVLRRHHA